MQTFAQAKAPEKSAPTHTGKNPSGNFNLPAPRSPVRAVLLGLGIQTKLKISHPEDAAEVEADQVAERVMAGDRASPSSASDGMAPSAPPSASAPPLSPSPPSTPPFRSAVSAVPANTAYREESEELVYEPDTMVHTAKKAGAGEPDELPGDISRRVAGMRHGGSPLPMGARAYLEPRFGHDFSGVRVHADAESGVLAESLHARAFTVGNHIAFGEGEYRPDTLGGRRLLAHELTHVVQQQGSQAMVHRDEEPGLWASIVNWGADQVYGLVREYAPGLEPVLREGPFNWLKRKLGGALNSVANGVRSLLPAGAVESIDATFGPLLERASQIVSALASGDCQPLLHAIDDIKNFLGQVAGEAWNGLTDLLRPVGDFFSNLWHGYGAPAAEWLQTFAGDLWHEITQLGEDIWNWTQPIRDGFASAWNWIKESLFGPADESSGDSSGGIVGWVTTKAGEAWDWVKEQARPVWEPVSQAVETVTALIPPPFIRALGESFQNLGNQLNAAGSDIGTEGDEVARNREALAAVLPSVQDMLGLARQGLVSAKAWMLETIGNLTGRFTGFLEGLRNSQVFSALAGTLSWLEDIGNGLSGWVQQKVAGLFDFVIQAFDAISPFVEKILGIIRQVINVAGDIMQLPSMILGSLWNLIPACIRNPIKDFLLNQILARIPVFSSLLQLPDIWARVEAVALRILRQVFVDGNLAGAAWTFFSNVLNLIGIPPQLVVSILAKAASAIGDILTNPVRFLITLVTGIGNGFRQFFSNIGTHLLNGISGWLFGALEGAGLTVPTEFTVRGVLGFVMQILDITVDRIFARLALRLSPAIVAGLRRAVSIATGVWEFVSVLVNEGVGGLWRLIQERLSNLWNTVLESAIGWITERVITQATIWLLGFLDISGIMPVVNTCLALYRGIQSAVEYMVPILRVIDMGLDGIGAMARGDPGPAANFVEAALGRGLPVAIGFLAAQLGLGNISARIRDIVAGVRELVDQGLDWLIDRAISMGQALIAMVRRGVSAVAGGVAALREWWRGRKNFRANNGEEHTLYFTGSGATSRLMIASAHPQPYGDFIQAVDIPNATPGQLAAKTQAVAIAAELDIAVHNAASAPASATSAVQGTGASRRSQVTAPAAADPALLINEILDRLATATAQFMPTGPANSTDPIYGSKVNEFGSSASVLRLAPVHPPGRQPGVTNPYWTALNRRKVGTGNYYIRGHLLNDNLGGPGNTWDNLTPLTQSANGMMRSRFENPVKQAVNGQTGPYRAPTTTNETANRKSVNFVVTANYGRPPRTQTVNTLRASGDANSMAIADVIEAEQYLPLSVTASAREVTATGGTGAVVAEATISNPIEQEISSYRVE